VLRTALRAIVRRRPAREGSVVAERARPVTERSATRPTGLERFIRRALYTDPALAMFGHMILAVAVKR
jgi:hypothetical protein